MFLGTGPKPSERYLSARMIGNLQMLSLCPTAVRTVFCFVPRASYSASKTRKLRYPATFVAVFSEKNHLDINNQPVIIQFTGQASQDEFPDA